LNLDYDKLNKAVTHLVTLRENTTPGGAPPSNSVNEELLIKAIKSKKFKKEDIDRLLAHLETQTRALPLLRIFLVEKKKDWVNSFKLNLANAQLRKNIFSWINQTLDKLSRNGKSLQPFEELKEAI
jgi:hypothetical protein